VLVAQIATVWQVVRTAHAGRVLSLSSAVLLGIAALGAAVSLFATDAVQSAPVLFLAGTVLYFLGPFLIVRDVVERQKVDRQTMLAALAAYLLVGMAFAFVYRFLGVVQSTHFFGPGGDGAMSDDLFFSFVTLTTTGYGNLVPADNPGQSLAVLEALVGQLFLVTAVAKIVNAWQPRRRQAGSGNGAAEAGQQKPLAAGVPPAPDEA
jgi:uncharacterized membrane protein HdeD (DUF308 family)